jgi:hypothetical protein
VYFSPVFYPLNPSSAQKAEQGVFLSAAVLFARTDSVYKSYPCLDVYDIDRDALTWTGGLPVIAHPPCRAWGQLRALANPRPGEKELALFAVDQVRRFGGVLEHPKNSTLWPEAGLPPPGEFDAYGGWTLPIFQNWFGHRAEKPTLLYIVGCAPADIPDLPLALGDATHVIGMQGRRRDGTRLHKGDIGWRPEVTKAEREHTPAPLAAWLVDLVHRCSPAGEPRFSSGSYVTPGQTAMGGSNP